ncbi:MAG: agmatinase family protein [Planctomycetes bacterium]|nr:agmatinase family protein [Planctomycetota bacterium]
MTPFDPNAAAAPESGIFGLPHSREEARLVLVPVPFDATTSYGGGAAEGPEAILAASHQVDLFDLQTGRPYEQGIHLLPERHGLRELSRRARALALPILERGGAGPGDGAAVAEVDAAGRRVNEVLEATVEELLARGKLVGVVGGDHSVPFGAIRTLARHHPGLGILHVDAHADLRHAFEGFAWSHASIMDNVLREVPEVARIVQVGVRDFCEEELAAIQESAGRVITHFDLDWQRRLLQGERWLDLAREAVGALPREVYVSFDIDGLDPALCPNTGTPVPGGLGFAQAALLLDEVMRSGRRIVGFDLNEVAPGADGDEWDANVGARVLYKLCGFALLAGT